MPSVEILFQTNLEMFSVSILPLNNILEFTACQERRRPAWAARALWGGLLAPSPSQAESRVASSLQDTQTFPLDSKSFLKKYLILNGYFPFTVITTYGLYSLCYTTHLRAYFIPNWGFPRGSDGKESACSVAHSKVRSLGQEDPLEKEMATHSSILTWRIPGQRSLVGYSPLGHKESKMTEWVTLWLSIYTQ